MLCQAKKERDGGGKKGEQRREMEGQSKANRGQKSNGVMAKPSKRETGNSLSLTELVLQGCSTEASTAQINTGNSRPDKPFITSL